MAIPSIYINLEDDVTKIVARLKHNPARQVVLVCPKRSFLFSDSINLRLLKKQTDLLGKEAFILTMDEKGQLYAREAGFSLKFLPKAGGAKNFSDVSFSKKELPVSEHVEEVGAEQDLVVEKKVAPAVAISTLVDPGPEVEVNDTIFPPDEILVESEAIKPKIGKWIWGVAIVSVIIVLLLIFVVLPKASVVVYPKTEPVTRDMDISLSTNAQSVDSAKLIMPAKTVNETVSVTGKFQSQGKSQVGNKATGSITFYNFTKLPINLKAQTTTLTIGNKTYNLVSDVSGLKPTTYKNAKTKEVDPASLSEPVDIIAASGGEDFNLPTGTRIEISNQVFGSNPQLLYAVTSSEIKGGTTRYLSVVSKEDIDAAKTQLQEQALKQINDKLGAEGSVLAERAYVLNITQFATDNPEGAQTPSLQATLQAQISGLSFKQADLDSLISQRISQTLSGNKTLEQGPDDRTVYKGKTLDLNNQLAVLQVHYQGQAVFGIDLGNLAPQLVAKSQNEVNEILRSKAEIDKVEITLAPSWQKNFPLFASKIKLIIQK